MLSLILLRNPGIFQRLRELVCGRFMWRDLVTVFMSSSSKYPLPPWLFRMHFVSCSRIRPRVNRPLLYDWMRGATIMAGLFCLQFLEMSRVYHYIRGQALVKLYVLIAMVEIFDKVWWMSTSHATRWFLCVCTAIPAMIALGCELFTGGCYSSISPHVG